LITDFDYHLHVISLLNFFVIFVSVSNLWISQNLSKLIFYSCL
jgi:hypothetical protein